MKRLSLLIASLILCMSGMMSQVITITFEGTVNGTPTPLDSIRVMNLTQGGDTMIYFPDNTLVLGSTGIGEMQTAAVALRSLPNPFAGSTEVVLDGVGGPSLIALHDLSGRELASVAANLSAGANRLQVSCELPGMHVLSVTQSGVRSALRLMATEGAGVSELSLMGGANRGAAKSDRSLFTWVAGDELRYIAYATSGGLLHSGAAQGVPSASITEEFAMAAGAVCPDSPTVTDIDGNVYPVVQIGSQCWMAANLKTTQYHDGNAIENVTNNIAWLQSSTGAWSNYSNSTANETIYGKLYNWYAAANPNICPQGWHLPTDSEWTLLELALGMPPSEINSTGYRGQTENVGGKMKTTSLWNPPNSTATNASAFSGLPGGYRGASDGNFSGLGDRGYWWSATESDASSVWLRALGSNFSGVDRFNRLKRNGLCVRCVKD